MNWYTNQCQITIFHSLASIFIITIDFGRFTYLQNNSSYPQYVIQAQRNPEEANVIIWYQEVSGRNMNLTQNISPKSYTKYIGTLHHGAVSCIAVGQELPNPLHTAARGEWPDQGIRSSVILCDPSVGDMTH